MDNKKLVSTLASKLGRSTDDISKLLDAFTNVVADKCGELDSIAIPSFGSFEPKKKNERIVVNPSTGKRMLVPPKVVMSFKISNVLKGKLK
ncbi:MAG: HU family DNA-binding protein [Bacteroidales bacterium]|nr:HU family DNA-binding protein [Candidatus Sodaliphilus fimicaballi]